jgi:hypothetical protein
LAFFWIYPCAGLPQCLLYRERDIAHCIAARQTNRIHVGHDGHKNERYNPSLSVAASASLFADYDFVRHKSSDYACLFLYPLGRSNNTGRGKEIVTQLNLFSAPAAMTIQTQARWDDLSVGHPQVDCVGGLVSAGFR